MIKQFLIVLACLCLAACATTNPPVAEPILNKQLTLDSPRFLTQTRYQSWMSTDVNLTVMSQPSTSTQLKKQNYVYLPTLSEYQNNTATWKQWQTKVGTEFRILGLLPQGTQFHFYRIDVEDCRYCVPIFYAMIDSGPFKGTAANYKFEKDDPRDQAFNRTLSS